MCVSTERLSHVSTGPLFIFESERIEERRERKYLGVREREKVFISGFWASGPFQGPLV